MNYSVKRFFSSLIFEGLIPIAGALLIAAFIWHISPPQAVSHTIPSSGTVHMQRTVSHHTEKQVNEAVKLTAPAKTGYSIVETESEIVTLVQSQPDPLEEGYKNLMSHTSVSSKGQSALDSMGLTTSLDDTIMLLAKLIYSEAGPNKLDQLMAGSVVLNHVYSDEFPTIHSLIDAIIAPNHYACWPYMIRNRVPSEEAIASAKQILSGEFPVPANIIFQAGFRQGTGGTFLMVDNKQYGRNFYNNYYCYNDSLSETDRYGSPALSAPELIVLAETLHQRDISNGLVSIEA